MEHQIEQKQAFTQKVQNNSNELETYYIPSQKQQKNQGQTAETAQQQKTQPQTNDKYGHHKNKKINKHKIKKEQEIVYKNLNPFKEQQKHFKLYQDRQTDFGLLFNLDNAKKVQVDGFVVYSLPAPQEGAYIVKGFNSQETVNLIGYLGLNEFWKKPYRTNLNSRNELYEEKEKQQGIKQIQGKFESIEKQITPEQFQKQVLQKGYCFNDKIRWANVGHQYDWTLRKYPEYHTPMHSAIQQLTDRANALYNKLQQTNISYRPESAIVNYYGVKDYMTGHLDDAEYDQVSPIYSFSFGLSCVFLMGGMDKNVKPLAVRLDSGDLMIMAKNSRKCYHGVPRIIADTYQQHPINYEPKQQVPQNFNSPKQVQNYFLKHRININIRQVFPQHKN